MLVKVINIFSHFPKELRELVHKFQFEFIAIVIFTSIANLLMLTPTIFMLQIYDRVMISRSEMTLIAVSLIAILGYSALSFSEWVRSRLIVRLSIKIDQLYIDKVFDASFMQSLENHQEVPNQAISDLSNIRQWLTGAGMFAFLDLPWTPIYIFFMFLLSPFLGALAILFVIVLIIIAIKSTKVINQASATLEEEEADLRKLVHDKLRNAEVIEAHGMLQPFLLRWWQRETSFLELSEKAKSNESRVTVFSKEIRYLMQSLALGAGAALVIKGDLSIGSMIAASVLMSRVTAPLDSIVSGWRSFLSVKTSYERIHHLLEKYPSVAKESLPEMFDPYYEINNIEIIVPKRLTPILAIDHMTLSSGFLYVIIGPSGSGKTTFIKSLLGIWPRMQGKVKISNLDIQTINRISFGARVGYLPQDVELFSGSIAENIARMGTVESEEVIKASQQAGLHEMILRLPQGYDTPIGTRGVQLSGGQRQRVGLARALYKDPNLIILDEPNSNLDQLGELALVQAIKGLKESGKTIFVIAHRGDLIQMADRLIVMKDGKVEEVVTQSEFSKRQNKLKAELIRKSV